jgi:hypothetical protein
MPVYLLKDESYLLKVQYNTQSVPRLNGSFKICAAIPKCFQKCVLVYPAVLCFHTGSLDMLAMLLHHTLSLEKISWAPVHELLHGLSMLLYLHFILLADIFNWIILPLDQILEVFFLSSLLTHSLVQYAFHLRLLSNWNLFHPLDHWLLSSSLYFSSFVWV